MLSNEELLALRNDLALIHQTLETFVFGPNTNFAVDCAGIATMRWMHKLEDELYRCTIQIEERN